MMFVIYQGLLIGIFAMLNVDGYKIQHNNSSNQTRGKANFMQADIPTNRRHGRQDSKFALTMKTTPIKNGEGLSITCKAEIECTVNSWSVKEQNGTYETVVRESTPFNRTKYGAQLNNMEGQTIYILIIYQVDRHDIHNDYRCDCDTSSGYLTAMNNNPTMMNNTKTTEDSRIRQQTLCTFYEETTKTYYRNDTLMMNNTKKIQDLSQNNAGFWSLGIAGIVILFIITILLYTKAASKNIIIHKERSDYSVHCSNNSLSSFSCDHAAATEIELMLNKHL